jgi:two-component system OmpR family response regulator
VGWLDRYTVRVLNRVKTVTAILVAEDDPDICAFLADILETELSAVVRCEGTGSLAFRAIETAAFDLAIIDVNMPEVSGFELARQATDRNIPVLLSSGHPDVGTKLDMSKCPYLSKPYRVAELIEKAAEAITRAGENIRQVKAALAGL